VDLNAKIVEKDPSILREQAGQGHANESTSRDLVKRALAWRAIYADPDGDWDPNYHPIDGGPPINFEEELWAAYAQLKTKDHVLHTDSGWVINHLGVLERQR
jgi:hypothetical protein